MLFVIISQFHFFPLGTEEASVQLLNQEISLKEGIEIIPSDYDEPIVIFFIMLF